MTTQPKALTSLLTLALFGFALLCDTSFASERALRAATPDIRTCVAEINRHADYTDALRVMHWVVGLEQRNIAELEIRIRTSVYVNKDTTVTKEYDTSCVTGALGNLVRFHFDSAASRRS